MTKAQKEAKELVDRFKEVTRPFSKRHTLKIYIHPEHAKNCALICVDREIASLWSVGHSFCFDRINELEEVKQEIEKL